MPNLESFTALDTRLFTSVKNQGTTESAAKAELLSMLQLQVDEVYSRSTKVKFEDFIELFQAVLRSKVFNIHKEVDLDNQFKLHNTKSKQKALSIVREKALSVFQDEFKTLSDANDYYAAEKRADFAVRQPIFGLPRQNWFKLFDGFTNSQRRIFELYNEMLDAEKAYAERNPDYRRGRALKVMSTSDDATRSMRHS